MKLKTVEIENFRAIEKLTLPLDPQLTILHGANAHGKTSLLAAIAMGLGAISHLLPGGFARRVFATDVRVGAPNLYVSLTTLDDVSWSGSLDFSTDSKPVRRRHVEALKDVVDELVRAHNQGLPVDLPIVACYGTDRVVLDLPEKPSEPSDFEADLGRYAALKGALSSGTNFQELFEWFYFKENRELREQRERRDLDYRIKDLTAVRHAISSMLNDVSEPHIEVNPHRFVVLLRTESENEKLDLGQLSGGYRAVLALAADLAWRMAHGNPHLDNPLDSEAIVLIDEVELHLHPAWQQRILNDLTRTFPNAQFIVSTHSPQVLTTVKPEHIVELARKDGAIVAGAAAGWTFGAEAGDVMSVVMGVDERPDNRFTETLASYRRLVSEGRGESKEARALRETLDTLSPEDPALASADLEIRQRKLFSQMAESE